MRLRPNSLLSRKYAGMLNWPGMRYPGETFQKEKRTRSLRRSGEIAGSVDNNVFRVRVGRGPAAQRSWDKRDPRPGGGIGKEDRMRDRLVDIVLFFLLALGIAILLGVLVLAEQPPYPVNDVGAQRDLDRIFLLMEKHQ